MKTAICAGGAFELMEPAILEAQSIGVDSVTGATGSSTGIKNAVRDALTQAYMAAGSSETEAESAINSLFMASSVKGERLVELDTDVVVVGAGAAGTVASLTALDSGVRVLNVEKTFRWGGQSMMTGGPKAYSPNTTEGEAQTILEAYESTLAHHRRGEEDERWNDPTYRSAHAGEFTGVNAEAYKAVIPASGLGVQKIMEYGVSFSVSMMGMLLEGNGDMPEGPPPASDVPPELLAADSVYTFGTSGEGMGLSYYQAEKYYGEAYDRYLENGGQALVSTTVTGLLYGADGSIVGVEAWGDDGTQYKVTAKAVVLATGGYGGNPELMEKWALGGEGWLYYGWQGNDGDGILMALEAGQPPTIWRLIP
ncbi:MAG: FAD-binding protein [Oscillospiraceae bacterium]|nr:FAD-binding protein [Oscillospiraceae bacterium]